ncbi:MAG: CHASE2 domain-containing protein [Geminicoccaceae bacterium]
MGDGTGLKSRTITAIVLGAAVLVQLLLQLPPLRSLSLTLDDLLLTFLAPAEPQHPGLALVTIDEDSLEGAVCRSPLDRDLLAGLISRLDRLGVRAIGLDLLLDQPTLAAADAHLARALRAPHAPIVVITAQPGTAMTDRQRAWHGEYLAGLPKGFANLTKDRLDGTVRRQEPVDAEGGLSFPAALAAAVGVQVDRTGTEIAWHGRPGPGTPPFPVYSAAMVQYLPPAWLAGRVVLIGTSLGSTDRHRTPFWALEGSTSGVDIQAHILAQLLDGTRMLRLPGWLDLALPAAAALGGLAVATSGLGLAAQLSLALLAPLAMLGTAGGVYALGGPLAWPLPSMLAWLTAQGLATMPLVMRERADRRVLMQLFSHHLSAPIARQVWEARDTFLVGGRPRPQTLTATVLFSDIEGSTGIAEALDPQALMGWLELYLQRMVPIVDRHDGVVLRFIGDGLLAAFGVPVPRQHEAAVETDARNAVACAAEMAEQLGRLNDDLVARGLPRIGLRIGIQTGEMTAGSVGHSDHLEYALMGDSVNTAARLESYAKTVRVPGCSSCTILIGGATAHRLPPNLPLRAVGEIELRGKDSRVPVFEVLTDSAGTLVVHKGGRPCDSA